MAPVRYPPMMVPPASNDGKAIASLVLGILSLVGCTGPLTGVPAIVLGVLARRDIARSGGALGGDGMALGGIITGALSTLLSVGMIILYVAVIGVAVASAPTSYTPTYTPPMVAPSFAPSASASVPRSSPGLKPMPPTGLLKVVDIRGGSGPLRAQLVTEILAANAFSEQALVVTGSRSCRACDEVWAAFAKPLLQSALVNVRLLRVDVDAFAGELPALGIDRPDLPWFFRMSDKLTVLDALSADEWDDNDATNIAPVLKAFMAGTYKKRPPGTVDAGRAKPNLSDPF